MSQLVHPVTLTDYSARTWVTGRAAFASQFNHEYKTIQNRISRLNQATKDVNSRHAGTTEPTSKQEGQIWFDTTNNFWMGDPDGLGADDNIATRLTAYQHSFKTAGTDTFKVRGLIESNTTAVNVLGAGGATQNLMTYTLPANTLTQRLTITSYGSVAAATLFNFNFQFGTAPATRITFSNNALTVWYVKIIISKISASACDIVMHKIRGTESGSVCAFDAATSGIDFTADQTIRWQLSSLVAGDDVTQEGMLIELLN